MKFILWILVFRLYFFSKIQNFLFITFFSTFCLNQICINLKNRLVTFWIVVYFMNFGFSNIFFSIRNFLFITWLFQICIDLKNRLVTLWVEVSFIYQQTRIRNGNSSRYVKISTQIKKTRGWAWKHNAFPFHGEDNLLPVSNKM